MSMPGNGRAAVSIIDALKGNPAVLALILTNVALLAFLFYSEGRASAQRKEIGQLIFDRCVPQKP
jgi:hypothetical protein